MERLDPVRGPAAAGGLDLESRLDRLVVPGPGGAVAGLHGGQPGAVPGAPVDPQLDLQAVFGERVWADRNRVALPAQFRTSKVPTVAQGIQVVGMAVLVYGLVELDLLAVVTGTVLTQTAKAWYLDRMVLLFEHMKALRPEYAAWEYPAEPATP
jgi:hypothetical protein